MKPEGLYKIFRLKHYLLLISFRALREKKRFYIFAFASHNQRVPEAQHNLFLVYNQLVNAMFHNAYAFLCGLFPNAVIGDHCE